MNYKQEYNRTWRKIKIMAVSYDTIIRKKLSKEYRIRDDKKYRRIGRPRNIDYIYFINYKKFKEVQMLLISSIIGSPIDPSFPYPDIIKELVNEKYFIRTTRKSRKRTD